MARTAASIPYATRALVLRVRPLGEKDRILTLFSPERGRISAVARGARAPRAKLAALAQPFVSARFLLAKGRSLDIITQGQIETVHPTIAGDLLKTSWASLACELADQIPNDVPDESGFDILEVFLKALDSAHGFAPCEAAGVWFQTQWLSHQGYAPTIGICVNCGQKIEGGEADRMWFGPTLGGTLCLNCRGAESSPENVSTQAMRALHRLSRSRRAPLDLSDVPFSLSVREQGEVSRCVRRALFTHLNHKLKSAPMLEDMRAAERLEV